MQGIFLYYGREPWHIVDTLVDVLVLCTQTMWWIYVGAFVVPLADAVEGRYPVYDNDAAAAAR